MTVEVNDFDLLSCLEPVSGQFWTVLFPHDVCETFGALWTVLLLDQFECIVPDSWLMPIDLYQLNDLEARELLSNEERNKWDLWRAPPDVEFWFSIATNQ